VTPDREQAGRFSGYVLRHRPDVLDLQLDEAGWADVDELVERSRSGPTALTRALIEELVRTCAKQRFRLSDDGRRVRASQGHSLDVELGLEQATPPATLFHGTVARFVPSILAQGLQRGRRHHVHLSGDEETARAVGARRGAPVVLRVDAAAMAAAGILFHRSDNGVWLTGHVPPEYLSGSDG